MRHFFFRRIDNYDSAQTKQVSEGDGVAINLRHCYTPSESKYNLYVCHQLPAKHCSQPPYLNILLVKALFDVILQPILNHDIRLVEGYRPAEKSMKMPKLPVPKLQDTIQKYTESIKPLIVQFGTETEHQNHHRLISEFKSHPSTVKAQSLLEQKALQSDKSWLIDWWNNYAYMSYRDSVVLNVSYFFHFKDDVRRRSQSLRAAGILRFALDFKAQVASGQLTADSMGKSALCMEQYKYMFNACRVPVAGSDQTFVAPPETQHVLVMRKGKLFTLQPVKQGQVRTERELAAIFDGIKKDADQYGTDGYPVGVLTSENRDAWAESYALLKDYSVANAEQLKLVESSSFVICLDDEPNKGLHPGASPLTRSEVGRALWHGDGKNRWYDKSLQFIVFENGKAGFLGEHSEMDATPNNRLCEFILNKCLSTEADGHVNAPMDATAVEKLQFGLNERLCVAIQKAQERFNWDIGRHDHAVLAYRKFGKNKIKTFKASPDAFVQLSIQLAYYKLFGVSRPTYESASTRKFGFGRTETVRSVSTDSLNFVQAAHERKGNLLQLAQKALESHGKYMGSATDAHGVDRHFLGLKFIMQENNLEVPQLLNDPFFKFSSNWYLSTSQITSEHYDGWGFGQVVPDGYGIAYSIKNDSVHYNIASLKDGPGSWKGGVGLTNACAKMKHALAEALDDLDEIFKAVPQQKSKL